VISHGENSVRGRPKCKGRAPAKPGCARLEVDHVARRECLRDLARARLHPRARDLRRTPRPREAYLVRARGKAHRTKSPAARRSLNASTTLSSTFGHLPMAGGRTTQIFVAAARACRRRSRNSGAWLRQFLTFLYIFFCARPRIRVSQPSHQSGTAQHTDQLQNARRGGGGTRSFSGTPEIAISTHGPFGLARQAASQRST
jgi:hypothetical protein